MTLNPAQAEGFARVALGHVTREWPHALAHVFEGPDDAKLPRTLHPIFYGSLDWHSCVHAYWLLATILRHVPSTPSAAAIHALFDTHLTHINVEAECAYFRRPVSRGFERPYGWAWLLALQHTLRGTPWAATLHPLATIIATRFKTFLPLAVYPVRVGTHFNTAFALTLAKPFAEANDPDLLHLLQDKALAWYGADAACQAWEPSQDEFLSPALMEAACMCHLLPPGPAKAWIDQFLPGLANQQPTTLFKPPIITDRSDGKIAHLDGLNLSRAWCLQEIAAVFPKDDPRRPVIAAAVEHHLAASMPHLASDFMGEHWLATFAALALWPSSLDG